MQTCKLVLARMADGLQCMDDDVRSKAAALIPDVITLYLCALQGSKTRVVCVVPSLRRLHEILI